MNREQLKELLPHRENMLLLDEAEPVSYTHLDVYKRQPPYTTLE